MASGDMVSLYVAVSDGAQPLTTDYHYRLANVVIQVIPIAGAHGIYWGDVERVTKAVQGAVDPCQTAIPGYISYDQPPGTFFNPSSFWVKAQTNGETYYVTASGVMV